MAVRALTVVEVMACIPTHVKQRHETRILWYSNNKDHMLLVPQLRRGLQLCGHQRQSEIQAKPLLASPDYPFCKGINSSRCKLFKNCCSVCKIAREGRSEL